MVIQYFGIYGVNCDKYKLGRSTPSTKEEYSTITRSISTGVEIGSDGELKMTVEETTSVSKQIDDISYEIHDNNEYGKKWTYTANTHSNQTKSEFVAVASQVYYLKKASDYKGKDFEFICDGYVEWDLPIRGWEHYHPNTNDGDNTHINLRKQYIYTVPQF